MGRGEVAPIRAVLLGFLQEGYFLLSSAGLFSSDAVSFSVGLSRMVRWAAALACRRFRDSFKTVIFIVDLRIFDRVYSAGYRRYSLTFYEAYINYELTVLFRGLFFLY